MIFRKLTLTFTRRKSLTALTLVVTLGIVSFRGLLDPLLESCVSYPTQAPQSRVFYSARGLMGFKTPAPPGPRHSMIQLFENAKARQDSKLKHQSQNLKMAVKEYRKRHHGRLPPKGFERWWKFVKEHQVVLVDEFDQIFKDLEPYYAIEPDRFRESVNEVHRRNGSPKFVLEFTNNGTFIRTSENQKSARMTDLIDLMESFKDYSQGVSKGFKMVINEGDGPEVRVTWRERAKLAELTRSGKFIDSQEHKQLSTARSLSEGCPPDATTYNLTDGFESLIYDHADSMEVCSNPEQIPLHGSLIVQQQRQFTTIAPLFSFCKTSVSSDIRVTPLEQYSPVHRGRVYDWEDPQRIQKLYWRGSTTGAHYGKDSSWRNTQRVRLCNITNPKMQTKQLADGQEINLSEVNPAWFDVKFTGRPIQCEPKECEELQEIFQFSGLESENTANRFKYAMDVDGNGWSGRFHKLLSSNRVIIKSTVYPEWFMDKIQPWYHYIPSKIDYSDLHDIVYFLRTHDAIAMQIARNAMEWAKTHWRREDMAAYMFRLMLEWSRLYNRNICDSGTKSDECDSLDFDLTQLYSA